MKWSINETDSRAVKAVISDFELDEAVTHVAPLGKGLINRTLRVRTRGGRQFVLQRLNSRVFPQPILVMRNLVRVLEHLRAKRRITLELIHTVSGGAWTTDTNNDTWRCFGYLTDSRTYASTNDRVVIREAARAFGQFALDLTDLPEPPLQEVIPGFHDTLARFRSLQDAVRDDVMNRAAAASREIAELFSHQDLSELFARPAATGELPRRNVHNDTKLANVLFHRKHAAALCVIDLDTVMPGLVLHDVGDFIRAAASTRGESEFPALDLVQFETLVEGYLSALGPLLTPSERYFLPDSPRVITLELAIRFLVDYLQGDRYFQTESPGQNLERCRSQLALLADMAAKADRMRTVWEAKFADFG